MTGEEGGEGEGGEGEENCHPLITSLLNEGAVIKTEKIWTNRQTKGWTNKQTNIKTNRQTTRKLNRWINWQTNRHGRDFSKLIEKDVYFQALFGISWKMLCPI